MGNNIVHVIGTGTIGEPLVGLLAVHREELVAITPPDQVLALPSY